MDRTAHLPAASTLPGRAGSASTGSPAGTSPRPGLKLRWGRTGIALAGAAAIPVALVTLVLALVSLVSFWWPFAAVLVAGGAVAALRALAVRDRRARVNAAFAAAMSSRPLGPQESGRPGTESVDADGPSRSAAPVRDVPVFDAQSAGTQAAPASRLTAAELLAAARAVAAADAPAGLRGGDVEAGGQEAGAAQQAPSGGTVGTSPWEPVQVPLPTYVEAEKARRSAPAPLELPAEPKPTVRTPIKSSVVAKAAPAEAPAAPAAPTAAGPRINLDDVLQRRRA